VTSGGEKQKIALAGVLAMYPRILLLDEPLASLDPASAHEALHVFRQLADEGISVMIVEHRVEDVLEIKPEVVLYMNEGRVSYNGNSAGLMQVVDYHSIKLPAPVIMARAKNDPQPIYNPVIQKQKDGRSLIEFKNVRFHYGDDTPEVLKGLNFKISQGDVIAVLGHNGSGKTTMVKSALGLLKPSSGEVMIGDKNSRQMTVAQAANTIGFVFQSPTQMLFAPTVRQELSFGPTNLQMPKAEITKSVDWAIETVHLKEEMETPPLALSFGQQKRVSIAAILAMRSRILMMDEPTAGQDYWNYTAFMDSILQMPGFDAVVFITHDVDLAVIYANRILLLFDGQVAADGSPFEVLQDEALLKKCRIRPTSLLRLNLALYEKTRQFFRGETLAHVAG
jgi:energy-coupling factor transporter ATP-binding protein EcfA2